MKKINDEMFLFKPCKTGAAFQANLRKDLRLDLTKCEKTLKENGYEIVLNTRNVLIVKSKYNISIFPSGRVLVKDITDEDEACKQVEKVYKILKLV